MYDLAKYKSISLFHCYMFQYPILSWIWYFFSMLLPLSYSVATLVSIFIAYLSTYHEALFNYGRNLIFGKSILHTYCKKWPTMREKCTVTWWNMHETPKSCFPLIPLVGLTPFEAFNFKIVAFIATRGAHHRTSFRAKS